MSASDIAGLAVLYKQFWGEESSSQLMTQKFKELQNNPHYIFLSAVEGNRLVGSVQGIICEELYGECKPFLVIENLVVDRQRRRQGVGRSLIAEMEKAAIKHGCYQVLFITENHRTEAVNFYSSLGFRKDTHKGFKKQLI
ncbi:GNAT family N-acetyltransferase [Dethiobacter alkaliphilus]|uniref:GCN5-related N-acetyltransferase n=1 Tax=Dethiobacter alkaliphilus AHT 1 TaxID=555088 RepID=C0GDC9_DETAL|nr:GNAT family N-acetyltransferase [Dethiobacter alkaliphilus]EEG78650.1 GCN5-related N-acetyltransferase [Dethiobacter alkaliphilus AHT 1]